MNFEQKLDVVISEIMDVYNLSEGQTKLIKNNIISRTKMYQNITPNFKNDETKIISNSSTIGDFFINRLITNIRDYDFDKTYNVENTNKGTYTSSKQSIYVGNFKFVEDITREKLQRRIPNIDTNTLRKAVINVFNHEVGHALQTSFKGKYGNNDEKYNILIENLTKKYSDTFKLQATDELLQTTHQGMIPKSKNDSKYKIRSYYSSVSFTTHLDEIFNEDEALKVTGVNQPQMKYNMGNEFYKNVYNYQSSNYKITSYARMMKIIMGEDKTFKSMYEDSIIAYEFFDQFKDLSDSVFQGSTYQGKAPMLNILNSLDQIRNHSSLAESLKLDLFLTECLRKKIFHELNSTNLTQNDINNMKTYVNEFTNQMVRNPNVVTQQDKIILNINKNIYEKEKQLNNNLDKNIDNNIKHQEIINKINHLKISVMSIHKEYKQMNLDNHIDINELNILINRMNYLAQTVNSIQLERLNENEKKILNQINSIIIDGQQKMNNKLTQYNTQEEKTSKSGYSK